MNISYFELSTDVSRSCCQTTPGIGGIFFWWSPVCHSQFRSEDVAFLVRMLGCGPDTTSHTVLCVLLMMSTLSFRFAPLGKWPVCCTGSIITSFCGVVCFATCLKGWINSFWLSFCSITVFLFLLSLLLLLRIGATVFVNTGLVCVPSTCSLLLSRGH